MKRKQQDSTNKSIEQIYHTLQSTNTDTLTFIKHSITRLSPEDFFNLLKWQLDEIHTLIRLKKPEKFFLCHLRS